MGDDSGNPIGSLLQWTVDERRRQQKQQDAAAAALPLAPSSAATAVPRTTRPSATREKVLREETYTHALEQIIQRDFFPDLPKLRAQVAYMEAVETGDFEKLRQVHAQVQPAHASGSTAGAATAGRRQDHTAVTLVAAAGMETPSMTPGIYHASNDWDTRSEVSSLPLQATSTTGTFSGNTLPSAAIQRDTQQLSLDAFQAKYTSEDNASFSEIVQKQNENQRRRFEWFFDSKKNQLLLKNSDSTSTADATVDEKLLEPPPSSGINEWKYTQKNSLIWYPEGIGSNLASQQLVVSQAAAADGGETIQAARGPPKAIAYSNTRFQKSTRPISSNASDTSSVAGEPALFERRPMLSPSGHVPADGSATPAVGGFKFVAATPSPAPDQPGATPMLTWGSIDGTPLLLDAGDVGPLDLNSTGPAFRIPEPPNRDRIAKKLADDVAAKQAERKRKPSSSLASSSLDRMAGGAGGSGGASPSIKRVGRIAALSPAAQVLLRKTSKTPSSGFLLPRTDRSMLRRGTSSIVGSGVGGKGATPSPWITRASAPSPAIPSAANVTTAATTTTATTTSTSSSSKKSITDGLLHI